MRGLQGSGSKGTQASRLRSMAALASKTAVLLAVLLAGCATTVNLTHKFEEPGVLPDGMALVYIYRPSEVFGAAIGYNVNVDNRLLVPLDIGGYYPYYVKPGRYAFSATTLSTSVAELSVEAGSTYYIQGTIASGLFWGRPLLRVVPPDIGSIEVSKCRLISPGREETPEITDD